MVWLYIVTGIAIMVWLISELVFLFQGAPFVQSTDDDVRQLVVLVKKYKPRRIIDLGSGDGKLVMALNHAGFCTDGIEVNPLLAYISLHQLKKKKYTGKIMWGNFWRKNLSDYDMVVLYGIHHIMPRLEKKLNK